MCCWPCAALTVVCSLERVGVLTSGRGVGRRHATSGEARLTASILLNLVMFGFSLIAALGTAFLAGPTLSGETESGIALAVLARPIRRSRSCSASGWGWWRSAAASWWSPAWPSASSSGRRSTTGHREPVAALALLAAQTFVLLTLAVLLSTAISPMASGVVAVGLFGATWIAGVVGGIGRRSATTRSPASAPCRGCCSPPTGCGAGRCTASRTRRR